MTLINQLPDETKANKYQIKTKVELITKEILDKRRSIVRDYHLDSKFFFCSKSLQIICQKVLKKE